MDYQERNALVEAHVHLIRPIVARISRKLPRSFGFDDLMQAGAIGLVTAAATFDRNRRVPFGVYARLKIRGAVLDAIAPEIRRGLRTAYLDDAPSVVATLAARDPQPDVAVLSGQLSRILVSALQRLTDRQRQVILMRFQGDIPLSAVAEILGVTEGRVCQIQKAALSALRQHIPVPRDSG